ncbi:MAG: acyl carrier protein [Bacteroidetes bacterium]|nr:acyl carrier protein [Bacteroidota bacterium]
MEELMQNLKHQIVEQLNLQQVKAEEICNEQNLFGPDGLGLDSIDALELIVLMQQKYGLKLANPADGQKIFQSVKTIAEYITQNQPK